jgi:hypothetical protein
LNAGGTTPLPSISISLQVCLRAFSRWLLIQPTCKAPQEGYKIPWSTLSQWE